LIYPKYPKTLKDLYFEDQKVISFDSSKDFVSEIANEWSLSSDYGSKRSLRQVLGLDFSEYDDLLKNRLSIVQLYKKYTQGTEKLVSSK